MAEDWAVAGFTLLVNPAHELFARTLALTGGDEVDMAAIDPIAREVSALSATRVAWRRSNEGRGTDRKEGGKLHTVHAATYGIETATGLLWSSHVLAVKGDEAQKALAPAARKHAVALRDDCYRVASESIQERRVKPGPAGQWAARILDITMAPELTRPSFEAQRLGGMPEAWQIPGV